MRYEVARTQRTNQKRAVLVVSLPFGEQEVEVLQMF
jgi:hypothetical protein